MTTPEGEGDPDEERRPPDDGLRYPDPRPLRQVQALTAGLIVIVVLFTLLSDSRPSEVRWGTLTGLVALVVVVLVVLRRRKPAISRGERRR